MKHFIALSLVLVALTAQAQTSSPKLWTLEECILYAVEHSPETNLQAERNEIARQDYREAIGALLPTLNAGVGADFNFGRSLGDDNVQLVQQLLPRPDQPHDLRRRPRHQHHPHAEDQSHYRCPRVCPASRRHASS